MNKQKKIWLIAFVLLSILGYVWIGYGITRTDFIQLLILYALIFGLYLFAIFRRIFEVKLPILLLVALLIRLSLLFMTPNLTDDYFRYIWDGILSSNGYNPYLFLPSEFVNSPQIITGNMPAIYEQLNSPNYYTAYPPMCQLLFFLSTKLAGGNVLGNIIILRVAVFFAEFGTILFLYKVACKLGKSPSLISIYAFNPLVIIELTGNLHFEAFMLFFLILAVYLLVQQKPNYAAICFGLAIGVKLIPLIFLPFLIKRLGIIKSLIFYSIVGITLAILFMPFFNTSLVADFISSIGLYFQKFEFNASIYYLFRWIGYEVMGYNIIASLGIILAIIILIIIITLAIKERVTTWQSFSQSMLICLTVYFILATTVHSWYITSILLVSVFTRFRYPLIWSLFIVLSYAAYRSLPYTENLWLVSLEYIAVAVWAIYEFRKKVPTENI
jgi:alpha-1,6-mannosyltransferase